MKKILLLILVCSLSSTALAQGEVTGAKHSVATNSFWANWFVQANVVGSSFWNSQEHQSVKLDELFKDYRTNLGFSLAVGKWFTPGLALRTKFNGLWGRTVIFESKELNASKYWTLQEQMLFNLSNMLMGYNEHRTWNVIPYFGGGVGHGVSYHTYVLGYSIGVLNTFRITPKLAFNIDINYGSYDASFDGFSGGADTKLSLKGRDRIINAEVGITYRLGKSSWKSSADLDAAQALAQSEIDALNAQLEDLMAENDRLNQELKLENAKKTLYKDIQQVYYNALNAHSKERSSKEAMQSSEDAFTLMQAKYENGKATITEFNEAKNKYLKAESDFVQARYERLYQSALLDFYRGKDLDF